MRRGQRLCRQCGRTVTEARVVGTNDLVEVVSVGMVAEADAAGLSLYVHSLLPGLVEAAEWASTMRASVRNREVRGPYLAAHTGACRRARGLAV